MAESRWTRHGASMLVLLRRVFERVVVIYRRIARSTRLRRLIIGALGAIGVVSGSLAIVDYKWPWEVERLDLPSLLHLESLDAEPSSVERDRLLNLMSRAGSATGPHDKEIVGGVYGQEPGWILAVIRDEDPLNLRLDTAHPSVYTQQGNLQCEFIIVEGEGRDDSPRAIVHGDPARDDVIGHMAEIFCAEVRDDMAVFLQVDASDPVMWPGNTDAPTESEWIAPFQDEINGVFAFYGR